MSKQLNLVFDFNNMAMRSLFTCAFSSSRDGVTITNFSTDAECGVLIRKLAIDMTYIIRMINPTKIIVCCDSQTPWRKKLLEDAAVGYKENRKKDENKDWKKIFSAFDEYKKILRKQNILVYEINDGEADDLAALLKQSLFKEQHDDIIYVSSDKDWLQLIDFDKSCNAFCNVLNPIANSHKRKPYNVHADYIKWLNDIDHSDIVSDIFFNNIDLIKNNMTELSKNNSIETFEIDPDQILLSKLLCGDNSDNVPSFYEFYKNGRISRITELKMKKIVNEFNLKSSQDFSNIAGTPEFKAFLEKVINYEITDINFQEHAEKQRKLVELNPSLFPKYIVSDYIYLLESAKENGVLTIKSPKMEDLLEGTKFYDKEKMTAPIVNDIFDAMKDLDKYIKPAFSSNALI